MKLLQLDEQRRKLLAEVEALKAQRNRVSKEIGALMGQKKTEEAEPRKKKPAIWATRSLPTGQASRRGEAARDKLMLQLPNLPHESVPIGKSAEDNPSRARLGAKSATFAFKPKSHVELCEQLEAGRFRARRETFRQRLPLYTNWGARLERALIQFLLDLHTTEHGYTEVSPPLYR